MATPRVRPTLQRPIRVVPRTALPKASYAFASPASLLQSKGFTPRAVDAVHPVPVIRGASHARQAKIVRSTAPRGGGLFSPVRQGSRPPASHAGGAYLILLLLLLLPSQLFAAGWADRQLVVGTNTVGDAGSLINGVGFTNGLLSATALGFSSITNTAGNGILTNQAGVFLTNFSANITMGGIVGLVAGQYFEINGIASNSDSATHSITFAGGTIGSGNGTPAVMWVTNANWNDFRESGILGLYTNLSFKPHY